MNNNHQVEIPNLLNQEFKYKSYKDWVFKITKYMKEQDKWGEVTYHMERAKNIYVELSKEYPSESLIHGDFHYYNILKNENGYKIIDPKGVLGNPIFDIPRYMLNEYWEKDDKLKADNIIEKVFNILSGKLNLPRELLSKLLYIEGAMSICWCIEDGADIAEKDNFIFNLEKLSKYLIQ